jgi:hypothetical protein
MEFVDVIFNFILTTLKWVIFYPLLLLVFWEVIISQMFGISFWSIMGLSHGSRWALKNFSPKQQPVKVSKPKDNKPNKQRKNNNQDLFYEDA